MASARSAEDLLLEDVYFSIDVESDGPIPGRFSMLSFAIVEAGHHDGMAYTAPESADETYYELVPISTEFETEALEVNRLSRERLFKEGTPPDLAMAAARDWIVERSGGRRPVMVASPASFDWMFIHWYFVNYLGDSPFGYSSCFDLRTLVAVKMNIPIARAGMKNLPTWIDSGTPRTHNALDDAKSQAQVFRNVLEWKIPTRHVFT